MKVPDTKDNMVKCICMDCPTYNDCMKQKMEGLFCSKGKSLCKIGETGCICGECPVTNEYDLARLYYCLIGAEK